MKTLPELEALSDDELRVMLAKIRGWTQIGTTGNHGVPYGLHPDPEKRSSHTLNDLPNYPGDLNACHEVEKRLKIEKADSAIGIVYWRHLMSQCVPIDHQVICATARQRTIALILTLQQPC